MPKVHPTAIIDDGAVLGADVVVGPYSMIGESVRLGDGCQVGSHVVIEGDTVIGPLNRFGHFSTIGIKPQDLKYKGERTRLRIGASNIFREYVNVSIGSVDGNFETVIGDGNFVMSYTHIAHDCLVGNGNIFANAATLAGHVTIADNSVIGGLTAIHQFTRIGSYVMIGGGSIVVQDVPPYIMVVGNRAGPVGINVKGLSRRGFSLENISAIKQAYRLMYMSKITTEEALKRIEAEVLPSNPVIGLFVEFCRKSKRGFAR